MPKYHNRKTVLDGMTFDSAAEAARWRELTLLEKAGHIRDLQRQVPIELVPGARLHGEKRARPAIRLVVDLTLKKRYSMQPGVAVRIDEVGAQ